MLPHRREDAELRKARQKPGRAAHVRTLKDRHVIMTPGATRFKAVDPLTGREERVTRREAQNLTQGRKLPKDKVPETWSSPKVFSRASRRALRGTR